jgi:hypothetical protein
VRTSLLIHLSCRKPFDQSQAGGVTAAGMDGYIGTGKWIPLKMNTSPAVVKKYNDSRTITFDVQQTDVPTATITDSKDVLKSKAVGAYFSNIFSRADIQAKDVVGTFYYKAINDVKLGKYANYNNDRVVFYMNDYTGKDFTGFVCLSSLYLSLFELCIDILAII